MGRKERIVSVLIILISAFFLMGFTYQPVETREVTKSKSPKLNIQGSYDFLDLSYKPATNQPVITEVKEYIIIIRYIIRGPEQYRIGIIVVHQIKKIIVINKNPRLEFKDLNGRRGRNNLNYNYKSPNKFCLYPANQQIISGQKNYLKLDVLCILKKLGGLKKENNKILNIVNQSPNRRLVFYLRQLIKVIKELYQLLSLKYILSLFMKLNVRLLIIFFISTLFP
jgi:hypothetical protein